MRYLLVSGYRGPVRGRHCRFGGVALAVAYWGFLTQFLYDNICQLLWTTTFLLLQSKWHNTLYGLSCNYLEAILERLDDSSCLILVEGRSSMQQDVVCPLDELGCTQEHLGTARWDHRTVTIHCEMRSQNCNNTLWDEITELQQYIVRKQNYNITKMTISLTISLSDMHC